MLRGDEAAVGQLLQLVARPGQVPHKVAVEPRLLWPRSTWTVFRTGHWQRDGSICDGWGLELILLQHADMNEKGQADLQGLVRVEVERKPAVWEEEVQTACAAV